MECYYSGWTNQAEVDKLDWRSSVLLPRVRFNGFDFRIYYPQSRAAKFTVTELGFHLVSRSRLSLSSGYEPELFADVLEELAEDFFSNPGKIREFLTGLSSAAVGEISTEQLLTEALEKRPHDFHFLLAATSFLPAALSARGEALAAAAIAAANGDAPRFLDSYFSLSL